MGSINGIMMLINDIYSRPNMYKSMTQLLPEGWSIKSNNENRLEATEYTLLWKNKILAYGKKDEEKKNYHANVYQEVLIEYLENDLGAIDIVLN